MCFVWLSDHMTCVDVSLNLMSDVNVLLQEEREREREFILWWAKLLGPVLKLTILLLQ